MERRGGVDDNERNTREELTEAVDDLRTALLTAATNFSARYYEGITLKKKGRNSRVSMPRYSYDDIRHRG